jgi:hypothetical protein
VQLQVGAAAEVNIIANSDVVEQGTVSTGMLVTSRQIEELPLAEGAPYTLATQAPVSSTRATRTSRVRRKRKPGGLSQQRYAGKSG